MSMSTRVTQASRFSRLVIDFRDTRRQTGGRDHAAETGWCRKRIRSISRAFQRLTWKGSRFTPKLFLWWLEGDRRGDEEGEGRGGGKSMTPWKPWKSNRPQARMRYWLQDQPRSMPRNSTYTRPRPSSTSYPQRVFSFHEQRTRCRFYPDSSRLYPAREAAIKLANCWPLAIFISINRWR